jgi:prepilin peptidase CpaA
MSPAVSSDLLVIMLVVAAGIVAAVIDINTRRVPNGLTGGVALAGLLLAATGLGRISLAAALAGGLLGLLVMLPGHLFGATGGGDVKLLAAFGTLLGPWDTIAAFFVTAIVGGLLAIGVAMQRGRLRQTLGTTVRLAAGGTVNVEEIEADRTFAYAPAIAIGAALAAIGA